MDEYFDILEKYYDANPTFTDPAGNVIDNIPYTILCDDWRYFCLENAPEFLDGYPNDGSCIVDPATKKIIDYNTTDTAVAYFKKLNEELGLTIVIVTHDVALTKKVKRVVAIRDGKISSERVLKEEFAFDDMYQFVIRIPREKVTNNHVKRAKDKIEHNKVIEIIE